MRYGVPLHKEKKAEQTRKNCLCRSVFITSICRKWGGCFDGRGSDLNMAENKKPVSEKRYGKIHTQA